MRLEQLRFLCEIVDRGFNVSRAADALHTSQPGVSKQIKLLEQELKFEILRRRKGRLVGLTEPGVAVVELARRILRDTRNIGRLREDFTRHDSGELVVATTHLHARYVLPQIIERFRQHHPRVQFRLLQVNPAEAIRVVSSARADMAIIGDPPDGAPELIQLPCYAFRRSLITPRGHPLLRDRPLTLQKLARHPQIALDRSYPGGMALTRAFERCEPKPDIVISGIDSDVIKAYVQLGLGIAVLPSVAFDRKLDTTLAAVDVTDLFGFSSAAIFIHPENYLRDYMYEFIHMVGPQWTRARIEKRLCKGLDRPQSRDQRNELSHVVDVATPLATDSVTAGAIGRRLRGRR